MDVYDQAERQEQMDRDVNIRAVLAQLLPDEPQVIVAAADGAPLIVCCDCHHAIHPKRLAILPYAVRCAPCQGEHEQRGRVYGD